MENDSEHSTGDSRWRLPRATGEQAVLSRGRDWAGIRPEWALAGCQAFVAAPRHRTAGKNLGGRVFLHNVVGGFGVLEGNGGVLLAGLPWQSVHDGDSYRHDPLRLTVCIQAPCYVMGEILDRHADVRQLFDNKGLSLYSYSIDEQGQMR